MGRASTSSFYSTLSKGPSEGASGRPPHRGVDGNGTRSLVLVLYGNSHSPQGVRFLSGPPLSSPSSFLSSMFHPGFSGSPLCSSVQGPAATTDS
jgi:hypothetical protein